MHVQSLTCFIRTLGELTFRYFWFGVVTQIVKLNDKTVLYCLLKCITNCLRLLAYIIILNHLYLSSVSLHRTGSQCWNTITGWMPLSQTWSWEILILSGFFLRTNVVSARMLLLQRALPPSRRQVKIIILLFYIFGWFLLGTD